MRKLAIFIHYSKDNKVCPNAMLYAEELTKYFNQVIIASNIIINSNNDKISCLCFEKNGYDIGYFYQTLELINAYDDYDMIGFFNDSNYIINSLDSVFEWCFNNDLDFCGITDSHGGRPEIKNKNQYHIQTHFLIFKNDAIRLLKEYFDKNDINTLIFNQNNFFKKRANTIIYYEIGLSIFMRENNIRMGSFYDAKEFILRHSNLPTQINIHTLLWKELVDNDYPLVKRKLVDISFNELDYNELSKSSMFPMEYSRTYVKRINNIYTNTINLNPRKEFEDICYKLTPFLSKEFPNIEDINKIKK